MAKLDFYDALQAINDQRSVSADEIQARALQRKVWIAEWHIPGCLSESFSVCLSKREAIESACSMAEGENGIPRGMKTALAKSGRFDSDSPMFGRVVNTIERRALWTLF